MNFAGLDLSLAETGCCVYHGGAPMEVTTVNAGTFKGVRRLSRLLERMAPRIPKGRVVVAVEGYSMGSRGRTFDIGEWGGIAKMHLYERGDVVCLLVPPKTLKMFVSGNGNASKSDMIKAVADLTGYVTKNDNKADAVGLALVARCWYYGNPVGLKQVKAMQTVKPCYPIPFSRSLARVRKRS